MEGDRFFPRRNGRLRRAQGFRKFPKYRNSAAAEYRPVKTVAAETPSATSAIIAAAAAFVLFSTIYLYSSEPSSLGVPQLQNFSSLDFQDASSAASSADVSLTIHFCLSPETHNCPELHDCIIASVIYRTFQCCLLYTSDAADE